MSFARVFPALIFSLLAIPLSVPALASEGQDDIDPRAVLDGAEENNPQLNSTGSGTEIPLLEKVSDKGTYLVQLAWPQVPLNPDGAFDLQLFFLNASQPTGINGTAGAPETNATGSGTETGATVPGTMQNFVDVESYDITIYSDDGDVLWQQLDQEGTAGAPGHRVLIGTYTGPVTIDVTDIRPGGETETAGGEDTTDSVQFSATVVPEFPLAILPLVAAVAGIIAALRVRAATRSP